MLKELKGRKRARAEPTATRYLFLRKPPPTWQQWLQRCSKDFDLESPHKIRLSGEFDNEKSVCLLQIYPNILPIDSHVEWHDLSFYIPYIWLVWRHGYPVPSDCLEHNLLLEIAIHSHGGLTAQCLEKLMGISCDWFVSHIIPTSTHIMVDFIPPCELLLTSLLKSPFIKLQSTFFLPKSLIMLSWGVETLRPGFRFMDCAIPHDIGECNPQSNHHLSLILPYVWYFKL